MLLVVVTVMFLMVVLVLTVDLWHLLGLTIIM